MIKRIIAMTPVAFQKELKRLLYRIQILLGTFITHEPEYKVLRNFVNEGDWVIDIGANVGHYTNKFSSLVGQSGRVIAFEPIPDTFFYLSENTLHSKYNNITLINAAVSIGTDLVNMKIPNFSSGLKNFYRASISFNQNESDTQVMTVSIDSLNIKKKINLIKIDAEGHEPQIFVGMDQILQRDKPILIVETVTDSIREKLFQLGYNEKKIKGSPNIIFTIHNIEIDY